MTIRLTYLRSLFLVIGMILFSNQASFASNSVTLYTPYTKIAVPPGESIDYTIDVINGSTELQNVDISLIGVPIGWTSSLKSGGWSITQLSILPGEKKNLSLKLEVPLQVNKGNYLFKILAGNYYSLPLVVIVSEKGTFKTEFTSKQANMEGHANATFTFNAELKNRTADKQLYALMAQAPRGWTVTFKANYKQATSVEIEANSTSNISIDINPPPQIEAGKYTIPVSASTNATSANLELEVVITGTYNLELTTPTGLLSTSITAGDEKQVELQIRNTGSSELKDIKLDFSAPNNWSVKFNTDKIAQLGSGASTNVYATIKADKKAIPGDYLTEFNAKAAEAVSKVSFRISVKTSMLWGWVGILIILIALGIVYNLFRKYGRR